MKKIFSLLLIIYFCFCSFGCSKDISLSYKTHTYQYLITKEHSSWQKKLVEIATQCYNIYQLNCVQNDRSSLIKTDFENVIVIGRFSLYANTQEFNYVCFDGAIRIFIKDDNGYWQTNRYSWNFYSSFNLGRNDFIKYGTESNAIKIRYLKDLTYLGTYGEGISTYWNPACINYSYKDILDRETKVDMWSSWSLRATENWYYRIQNEMYYTYNLHVVIF